MNSMKLKLSEPMWENYNNGVANPIARVLNTDVIMKVLALIISLGIFLLDLVSNTQSAIGVLYIMPLTMLISHNRKMIITLASLTCLLLLADPRLIYGHPGYDSIYTDKLLSFVAIALTTFGILRYKKLHEKASQSKDEQVKKLEELLFATSQNVQKPVSNIHGLSMIMKTETSEEEREWILRSMKESANELDQCSRQLTKYASAAVN